MPTSKCQFCNKKFIYRKHGKYRPKFCCSFCYWKNLKGRKLSTNHLFKLKGRIPWNKGIKWIEQTGNRNSRWKGGKYLDSRGIIMILCPKHPSVKNYKQNKYVPEHRLIMEKYLGRYLHSWEIVHHINGIKIDNHIKNLELHNRSSHAKNHFPKGSLFGQNSKSF